jgi:hypothetical protein
MDHGGTTAVISFELLARHLSGAPNPQPCRVRIGLRCGAHAMIEINT